MNLMNRGEAVRTSGSGRLSYPLHKVVAAIARSETDGVVMALEAAGFARDGIDVITAQDVSGLAEPIGGSGLRGFLTRLNLSAGADLDEIEKARRELSFGHALVLVLVHGNAEQDRADGVLRQHGGHTMSYFGRWTVTTLDGDAR